MCTIDDSLSVRIEGLIVFDPAFDRPRRLRFVTQRPQLDPAHG